MYFCRFMSSIKHTDRPLRLNRVLVTVFLFMLIGMAMELYLLGHFEDTQQLIPLLCIGACLVFAGLVYYKRTLLVQRLFKLILLLTALSGVYGSYLHIRANFEFEQEMKPGLQGWELFTESLSGALPALAPASMIALALIGYSYYLLIKPQ